MVSDSMKSAGNRLNKEVWLQKSLDILAGEGDTKLTIDHVVKSMGVTKGSFYWHFKNRADFVTSLVDYWKNRFTALVANALEPINDPSQRLLTLMALLTDGNHSRYDVAIINWAQHEPTAKRTVQEVFDIRTGFLRSIFMELGFQGDDLEMRVQTMVFFQVMESSLYTRLSKEQRHRYVKCRHAMLTQQ